MQYERVKGHGDTDQMGRGPHSQGGTIRRRGKSCFPRSTLVFMQIVSASKPLSAVQTPPIRARCCKSFFSFFSLSSEPVSCDVVVTASTSPRPHTGNIPSAPPRHCNYLTNLMAATTTTTSTLCGEPSTCWTCPHMRCRHTQATLPPSPSLCLVHLKKASDKSFPLFFPFVFNGAGHLPSTQAHCTPHGTQTPTPPPLTCMQATLSLSLSPQPPPPQCLYNWHHFPDPVALQLASPDFTTQTGGAKAGPHHFHETPICSPSLLRPGPFYLIFTDSFSYD